MGDVATIAAALCGGAFVVFLVAVWGGRQRTNGLTPELNQLRAQQAKAKRPNVDFAWSYADEQAYGRGHGDTPAAEAVDLTRNAGRSIFDQMRANMIAAGKSTPFDTPDNLPPNVRPEVLQRAWNAEANAQAAAKITREAKADQVIDGKFNDAPSAPAPKPSGKFEMEYRREWEK